MFYRLFTLTFSTQCIYVLCVIIYLNGNNRRVFVMQINRIYSVL